ncbi:hypothetical protein A3B57_02745 [Microgenomates group bacterium RIFCSPLOWO2_01_FULL_47_10]|nr:MAG: hypothetical protein A3B57_02745 [Microgenomates group bacterium RIFCSPLOWO2_01_FULL_47_10]
MKITGSIVRPFIPFVISLGVFVAIIIWFTANFTDYRPNIPLLNRHSGQFRITVPDKVHYNQPFKAVFSLDTNGRSVNAIGLIINYENDNLRVVTIDTTKSFCQFYPEKKFNDSLGKVFLSCGSPSPGFSGESTVIEVEFMPVKIGQTSLLLDQNSKILLSDGKGSNILTEFPKASITIINTL